MTLDTTIDYAPPRRFYPGRRRPAPAQPRVPSRAYRLAVVGMVFATLLLQHGGI